MKKNVEVRKSAIHGKGLFAASPLAAGELLGYCEITPWPRQTAHTLYIDGNFFRVNCSFRYINHNKNPNVIYYDDFSVCTLRDIEPGEELTHDYGEDWD